MELSDTELLAELADPSEAEPELPSSVIAGRRRANDLEGAEWTRLSLSVWSDLRKRPDEAALKHPAMFPEVLVERLIRCFTRSGEATVLDPFCGSGSTLVAARRRGKRGIGFDVCPQYLETAQQRLEELDAEGASEYELIEEDARLVGDFVPENSVDLCVTSPPYWDILAMKRSADGRPGRDYAGGAEDLSRIDDYDQFVEELGNVFDQVYLVLKPGAYCVVNVMDLRKKSRFYPFHSDLATRLTAPELGGQFEYDDLVIWDRRQDYNSLRPLGYPSRFRINKIHEYLLIFRKPA